MISIIYLTVSIAVFAVIFKVSRNNKLKRPPGPICIPMFGNILEIGLTPHLRFTEWAAKYGPIVQFKIGRQNAVIVTDPKMAKCVLHDSAFSGRMTDNPVIRQFGEGRGILNADGSTWEEQRHFVVYLFRNFGFQDSRVENIITDEAKRIMLSLKKTEGSAFSTHRMFFGPVVNCTWSIVAGKRLEWEKDDERLVNSASAFFKALMKVTSGGILFAPMLRWILPGKSGWNDYVKCLREFSDLIDECVEEHKVTFQADNLRDFVDQYIVKIKECKNPKSSFYQEIGYMNLNAVLMDLFVGGSESTSSLLSWTLLYLSNHKIVQDKVQAEIDNIIGSGTPLITHRESMPYTEAVIMEVLRIVSIAPLGAPHRLLEDVNFFGYHLPKDTSVFVNIYGLNHDLHFWKHPFTFWPDRFLNENGKALKYPTAFMPFADGRRKCIGDKLSKNITFIFLANICQTYTVLGDPDMKKETDMTPEVGAVLSPKPHKLLMSRRNHNNNK